MGQPLKDEIIRTAKYFLTCLTVPEDDLWVNFSPYEKDRIVPGNFGITLMGKDLLEQDYLLKQIMASLSYPENDLGKRFWQRVYQKSYELYGTTDIPINTFNKVWILPKSAEVYAQGNSAFVVNSQLDVMLEADYKAFVHHLDIKNLGLNKQGFSQKAGAYSQVFRDVILPELRQEVNEGKNFAVVRQVYNAMILATWYKRHLKDSLLGRMYVGRNEVRGVDIADKNAKEKIFRQYLRAYKKCVYNYIKEDYDPMTQQAVPRKYASGGMYFSGFRSDSAMYVEVPNPKGMAIGPKLVLTTVDVTATDSNGAMVSFPPLEAEITHTHPFYQILSEAKSASYDPAMLSRLHLPKFFNNSIVGVMFAIGIAAISPSALHGATFTAGQTTPDGKVTIIMHVDDGDQLGKAMEDIRVTYKKLSPEEYKTSAYTGPLYSALDKVTHVENKEVFKKGDTVPFNEPVPQNVMEALETLPGSVAGAVQMGIGSTPPAPLAVQETLRQISPPVVSSPASQPAPEASAGKGYKSIAEQLAAFDANAQAQRILPDTNWRLDQFPQNQLPFGSTITTGLNTFEINNADVEMKKREADLRAAQQQTPGGNGSSGGGPGGPPPDWWMRGGIAAAVLFGTAGWLAKRQGIISIQITIGRKNSKIADHPPLEEVSPPEPSSIPMGNIFNFVDPLPNEGQEDQAQLAESDRLPARASKEEMAIQEEDLRRLLDVAEGRVKPHSPRMAEEDHITGDGGGQYLKWMDRLSWTGLGISFLAFLAGAGPLWMLAANPVTTRILYVAQKWLHEKFHLVAATPAYPGKLTSIWSARNSLRGNLGLLQWLRQLIPNTRVDRSFVDLRPFASVKNSKPKNKIIARSAFYGTFFLAVYAGFLLWSTPFIAPLVLSAIRVLKESFQSGDLTGTRESDMGKFGCGILVLGKSVFTPFVYKNDLRGWISWYYYVKGVLRRRGGQQAGDETDIIGSDGGQRHILEKITNELRSAGWDKGLVLWEDMIEKLHERFFKALPEKLVPLYNYVKVGLFPIRGHNRWSTVRGFNGMDDEAAQPQPSAEKVREKWVWDAVLKRTRKVLRVFRVDVAFNGDHMKPDLTFAELRRIFPAMAYLYYPKFVTYGYLKKKVSDGREEKQQVPTNYQSVLNALRTKGYISKFWGKVNPEFKGVDQEFRSWFPEYKKDIFAQINSALYGMPAGDAQLLSLENDIEEDDGCWAAAIRAAHYGSLPKTKEALESNILPEIQSLAAGDVFSQVFDQVEEFVNRRGYMPDGDAAMKSLLDMYVGDKKTAEQLNLSAQYQMIEAFEGMLEQRWKLEASQNTEAGKFFKKWDDRWKSQWVERQEGARMVWSSTTVRSNTSMENVWSLSSCQQRGFIQLTG